MKTMSLKCLHVIFLITIFAIPVLAQNTDQMSRVQSELERTDEIIERAREASRAVNAPVAAIALQNAVELQEMAYNSFRKRYHNEAYKQTLKAREEAKKVLAASRITEQGENIVLRKLERAQEFLGKAKESLPVGPDGRLRTLYESARTNLNRGWEFYRARQYRAALKLANQVDKITQEIITAANRHTRMQADYEHRYEMVGELLDQARQRITQCDDKQQSAEIIEQAEKLSLKSREFFLQGNIDGALRNLQKARQMAVRASQKCKGSQNLNERYEQLKNDADQLMEKISPEDTATRKLLEQAYQQLRLAREEISREQTAAATAALKAAHLTLNQVRNSLSPNNQ